MRQKRFQKGSVRPRKHGKNKVWVAQWWEDRRKKSKVLGRCTTKGKSEAEAAMAVILKPQNGQTQEPVYNSEASRAIRCRCSWTKKPTHYRAVLWTISGGTSTTFSLADGLVDSNPAAALFTPPCKPEREKRVMSPEEIRVALGLLGPRERLIFRMAVFDGMRPGEILAIRIGNISGESVLIDQRAYKRNIDTPKDRKGKRTSRTVGLSTGTIAELRVWRMLLLKQGPES